MECKVRCSDGIEGVCNGTESANITTDEGTDVVDTSGIRNDIPITTDEDTDVDNGSIVNDGSIMDQMQNNPVYSECDPTISPTTSTSTNTIQSLFQDINKHISEAQKYILSQRSNRISLNLM